MLVFHIFLNNPWKKSIEIKGVRYEYSETLKKVSFILHWTRFFVFLLFIAIGLILVNNDVKIMIIDIHSSFFAFFVIVLAFLVTAPMYYIFLPKPLHEHLTKIDL